MVQSFSDLLNTAQEMSVVPYRRSARVAAGGALARYAWDNRRSIQTYGQRAMSYARNAMRSSSRRSFRRTPARSGYSGQGVTAQHDVSNVYRKKNMPRGKKRRWRRFVQKIHAAAEKDLGTRTVLLNDAASITNTTANKQICLTVALYGQRSTTSHLNDMYQISALENFEANPTTAGGITTEKSTKIMFQSGVLDITVRNTTFQSDNNSISAKMEIDVYELFIKKDALSSLTAYNNLSSLLSLGYTDTKNIGGIGTGITSDDRGVTPFECPFALSRFGIKILSKKKYFLEGGGTFTYQVRDPRRRVCDTQDLISRQGFNRRGWTRIIYIVGKIVPGYTVGAAAGQYTESLNLGITRKYFYKIQGANDDRDRYVSASNVVTNPG